MSHDFVGCIRSFIINGQDKLKAVPDASEGVVDECPRSTSVNVCLGWDCRNDGVCVDKWEAPVCRCGSKYTGVMCEKGRTSVMEHGTEIKLSLKYSNNEFWDKSIDDMSHTMRKPVYVTCRQQRRRSACASAQSD